MLVNALVVSAKSARNSASRSQKQGAHAPPKSSALALLALVSASAGVRALVNIFYCIY
jgi:hypothetical protein